MLSSLLFSLSLFFFLSLHESECVSFILCFCLFSFKTTFTICLRVLSVHVFLDPTNVQEALVLENRESLHRQEG